MGTNRRRRGTHRRRRGVNGRLLTVLGAQVVVFGGVTLGLASTHPGATSVVASPSSAAVSAPSQVRVAKPAPSPTPSEVQYVTPVVGATATVTKSFMLPAIGLATFQNAMLPNSIPDDRGVQVGSIGSGLFPLGDNEYWTVTDRGPNPEIVDDVRTFVVPEFNPALVRIKVTHSTIAVLESIPITNAKGKPVTGMPNRASGEESVPLAADGQTVLPYNINGLDPEGIVRTADGHFWVSDEYAPSIVELDAEGHILMRHLPAGTDGTYQAAGVKYPVAGSLPAALANRKPNRGLEDLALLPDGKTIVTALQSSLVVPDEEDRIITELLSFDTGTGETVHEFPYQFDDPGTFDDRGRKLKISALVPVDASHVIVQERTDTQSRYYLVELNPADDLITGPDKRLVVNLAGVAGVPGKIEGAVLTAPDTMVLSTDNDFGLAARPYAAGERVQDSGERTQVFEVKLVAPPQ